MAQRVGNINIHTPLLGRIEKLQIYNDQLRVVLNDKSRMIDYLMFQLGQMDQLKKESETLRAENARLLQENEQFKKKLLDADKFLF